MLCKLFGCHQVASKGDVISSSIYVSAPTPSAALAIESAKIAGCCFCGRLLLLVDECFVTGVAQCTFVQQFTTAHELDQESAIVDAVLMTDCILKVFAWIRKPVMPSLLLYLKIKTPQLLSSLASICQ